MNQSAKSFFYANCQQLARNGKWVKAQRDDFEKKNQHGRPEGRGVGWTRLRSHLGPHTSCDPG